MCSLFPSFFRLARCPARVPAGAFRGGGPQLRGVQLGGRAALPRQRLLVPLLAALPRVQLSLRRHQGHGGQPGEEQRRLGWLQPRVHGLRYTGYNDMCNEHNFLWVTKMKHSNLTRNVLQSLNLSNEAFPRNHFH